MGGERHLGQFHWTHCNPTLPDKPMQMNQALFMAGGHCGYVLQPSTMRDEAFDPFDKSSLRGLEPCVICIEVGVFIWVIQGGERCMRNMDTKLERSWGPGGSA